MLRSLAVVVFIAGVGAMAIYVAQRPTIAHGDVIGADLVESNKATVRAMHCDDEIEVGATGAAFSCRAEFKTGATEELQFTMDRVGMIGQRAAQPHPQVKKSSDPWGD